MGVLFAELGEEGAEFSDVVVGEDAEGGSGGSRGIDEAGVGELVEDDMVAFPDDDGDGGEGGGVA